MKFAILIYFENMEIRKGKKKYDKGKGKNKFKIKGKIILPISNIFFRIIFYKINNFEINNFQINGHGKYKIPIIPRIKIQIKKNKIYIKEKVIKEKKIKYY
jgi:hypothetical protein